MKIKYSITCIALLLMTFLGFAQDTPFYETYSWGENPQYKINYSEEEKLATLKHKVVTEFVFEAQDQLVEYYLEHKMLWLNSDESIESYNKVYIPYGASSEIILNKARVINQDGTVLELDESKILEAMNEETGRKYKYFAFEGIEKGSVIDYYYVTKEDPDYKGSRITLQKSHPQEKVSFDLFAPTNLIFDFKSYNGLPAVMEDTLMKDKLHWYLPELKIKGLEKEETAAYNASKKFLIYKLDKNLASNRVDISSYSSTVKTLYGFYYPEYEKKTQKLIDGYLTKHLKKHEDEQQTIRNLENYLKTNVFNSNTSGKELSDLNSVLANNVANETGLLKLYIALLRTLNIKHELVITSNRQDLKFDANFEARNFLTEFMFYFPKYKTYLSPHELDSRYGFPPAYFTDNYGLFIKEVAIGEFKSGIGKVKYIDAIDAEASSDKMILNVSFDTDDLTKCNVSMEKSMTGYYAMYIQPFMFAIKKEDRKELVEGIVQGINESAVMDEFQLLNDDADLFGVKPFQINVDFNSSAFIEKAGRKYLFKVGELIGPQMQIYNEKERILPVESEFNRSYYRTIYVDIPEGFNVANLDDINIKNAYSENGLEYFSFHSYYEIKGNKLKITADEFYRKNIVRPELYEQYRKVINSAADFNKITLVLQPKP